MLCMSAPRTTVNRPRIVGCSDSILESKATGPVVNGSDFTATSELGSHRPSDLTPDCHYVNLSDTASGNIKAWLQGPSLRCVKALRQRNSLSH